MTIFKRALVMFFVAVFCASSIISVSAADFIIDGYTFDGIFSTMIANTTLTDETGTFTHLSPTAQYQACNTFREVNNGNASRTKGKLIWEMDIRLYKASAANGGGEYAVMVDLGAGASSQVIPIYLHHYRTTDNFYIATGGAAVGANVSIVPAATNFPNGGDPQLFDYGKWYKLKVGVDTVNMYYSVELIDANVAPTVIYKRSEYLNAALKTSLSETYYYGSDRYVSFTMQNLSSTFATNNLDFKNLKVTTEKFVTYIPPVVNVANGAVTASAEGYCTIQSSASASIPTMAPYILLGIYDNSTGMLVNSSIKSGQAATRFSGTSFPKTTYTTSSLNVSTLPNGAYTARAFLWTDLNSIKPHQAIGTKTFTVADGVVTVQ